MREDSDPEREYCAHGSGIRLGYPMAVRNGCIGGCTLFTGSGRSSAFVFLRSYLGCSGYLESDGSEGLVHRHAGYEECDGGRYRGERYQHGSQLLPGCLYAAGGSGRRMGNADRAVLWIDSGRFYSGCWL